MTSPCRLIAGKSPVVCSVGNIATLYCRVHYSSPIDARLVIDERVAAEKQNEADSRGFPYDCRGKRRLIFRLREKQTRAPRLCERQNHSPKSTSILRGFPRESLYGSGFFLFFFFFLVRVEETTKCAVCVNASQILSFPCTITKRQLNDSPLDGARSMWTTAT